jgi:hypothetical protein
MGRAACFSLVLLVGISAQAQPAAPHVAYLYPAGGKTGTTFTVTIGGQALGGATNVYCSGEGIQAAVLDYSRPMTQKEFNDARDKMRELQERRQAANRAGRANAPSGTNVVWTAADERALAEMRMKVADFALKRNASPALAEKLTLRITLEPQAVPGARELRVRTVGGLSNPMSFWVGELPEFAKKEFKPAMEPGMLRNLRNNTEQKAVPPSEMTISLPASVNGQILPGGVDRYRFAARAGQRLVFVVRARELVPYLPDAVPGWFQATLALYDLKGKELAYDDDFRFNPDPVLYYEIAKDGEYVFEIKDAVYRGREDFVYRVTAGELPFVTSVFPLGARAGQAANVELSGWNLPTTNVTLTTSNLSAGTYPLSQLAGQDAPGSLLFALDDWPETAEREPNDSIALAQRVSLPCVINGRIVRPGDVDVFKFEGRAGQELVAEVQARRLGSPLDSQLKLTDAAGRQIAFNDDFEDKGAGLTTHQADSRLEVTLATNGTYYLQLSDAQHQGGGEFAYRLRLSAPQPDFALRAVPSSVTLRGGASAPLTVYALRKDGFTNAISIALSDAPPGFTVSGGRIPAGADRVRVTVTAPASSANEAVSVSLEGSAVVGGRVVARPVVPADDEMQAFFYHHLVPAKELKVAVLPGRMGGRSGVKLLSESPVKIPAGGTARVRFDAPMGVGGGRLELELSEPPDGITIENINAAGGGTEIVLRSDAAKVKTGQTGNLIVCAYPGKAAKTGKNNPQANRQRTPLASLPAIPFEVVAQ